MFAQEGHKLNLGIDFSFNMNYTFDSDEKTKDPAALGFSAGYEYDVNMFFGIEAGFRVGGFNQNIRFDNPNQSTDPVVNLQNHIKDNYEGTYWAPFIAPKLYLPVGWSEKHDRPRFIYLENRFSFSNIHLKLDKNFNNREAHNRFQFQYEVKLGYQFPIDDRWAMNCWLGYNTFDFSRVKPEAMRFKNSTPIQIGVGFNYIIKQ